MILIKSVPLSCLKSSTLCEEWKIGLSVAVLKERIADRLEITCDKFLLYRGPQRLNDSDCVHDDDIVHLHCSLLGGKGGFGSMLRAIGAQIEKTTNKEACRDLSGRRLRDINEEQRLKKWIAKQAEREKERLERKRERLERLQTKPKHKFYDPEYDKVFSNMAENIDDALTEGLKRAETEDTSTKRKNVTEEPSTSSKRLKHSLGFSDELDCLSSSDSDDETDSSMEDSTPLQATSTSEDSTEIQASGSTSENQTPNEPATSKNIVEPCHLDLEPFNSVEELEKLGLDRLKAALMDRGMKCGGTLKQRAERLLAVKGKKEIDPILLVKTNK